jgi:2-C-methyl-D-erythritol 4-phosphate cytidylyltransferase
VGEPSEIVAIIVAAGEGRRLGEPGLRKQYRDLAGEAILLRAIRPFLESPAVSRVVVVLPPEDVDTPPEWLATLPIDRIGGGAERSDSVRNGLAAIGERTATILVHDGARPFVAPRLVERILTAVADCPGDAVIPGLPLTDTVKEVDDGGFVIRTVPRDHLWQVQTPQAFPATILRQVHAKAARSEFRPSDDAALLEHYGHTVRIVEGDPDNIKVTTSMDLAVAQILAHRLRDST